MVSQYEIPGIYRDDVSPLPPAILLTGVPVFLGLMALPEQSPKLQPFTPGQAPKLQPFTLWTQFQASWSKFQDELSKFQDELKEKDPKRPDSYLPSAIRGFFENGGRACYVLGLSSLTSLEEALTELELLTDIDLICLPDLQQAEASQISAMQLSILAHCERMGDRFAILDAPASSVPTTQAMESLRSGRFSSYGAMYAPWVCVRESGTNKSSAAPKPVPPCGHIAGIYAQSDRSNGAHHAPANYVIEGIVNLNRAFSEAEQKTYQELGINCLRVLPGRGIRVWGARTLSQESIWRSINVRRLFVTVFRWIEQNMADIAFEPNDFSLWIRIERELTTYFESLHRQGALQGRTPQEAFYVKCNETTNPPNNREAGRVVTEIGLAPTLPSEFIVVRLIHGDTGVQIES